MNPTDARPKEFCGAHTAAHESDPRPERSTRAVPGPPRRGPDRPVSPVDPGRWHCDVQLPALPQMLGPATGAPGRPGGAGPGAHRPTLRPVPVADVCAAPLARASAGEMASGDHPTLVCLVAPGCRTAGARTARTRPPASTTTTKPAGFAACCAPPATGLKTCTAAGSGCASTPCRAASRTSGKPRPPAPLGGSRRLLRSTGAPRRKQGHRSAGWLVGAGDSPSVADDDQEAGLRQVHELHLPEITLAALRPRQRPQLPGTVGQARRRTPLPGRRPQAVGAQPAVRRRRHHRPVLTWADIGLSVGPETMEPGETALQGHLLTMETTRTTRLALNKEWAVGARIGGGGFGAVFEAESTAGEKTAEARAQAAGHRAPSARCSSPTWTASATWCQGSTAVSTKTSEYW